MNLIAKKNLKKYLRWFFKLQIPETFLIEATAEENLIYYYEYEDFYG